MGLVRLFFIGGACEGKLFVVDGGLITFFDTDKAAGGMTRVVTRRMGTSLFRVRPGVPCAGTSLS